LAVVSFSDFTARLLFVALLLRCRGAFYGPSSSGFTARHLFVALLAAE